MISRANDTLFFHSIMNTDYLGKGKPEGANKITSRPILISNYYLKCLVIIFHTKNSSFCLFVSA